MLIFMVGEDNGKNNYIEILIVKTECVRIRGNIESY